MAAGQNAEISPVLFVSVEGEPMSFYLRPGPLKRQLQPLITAGGGSLCGVQKPGAVLLIDPEERSSIPESTSYWYVSAQYIHDCVEKEEQLDMEDYRLQPDKRGRPSTRLSSSREGSSVLLGGRIPYTPEEDAAILNYVTQRESEVGGNRIWQRMEKQHLTAHSWQSMKSRYKLQLANRRARREPDAAQSNAKAAGGGTEDSGVPKPEEQAASPQEHPAGPELTPVRQQGDERLEPAGSKSQDEEEEAEPKEEPSDCHQTEEPAVDSQSEDQAAVQPEGSEMSEAAQPETSDGKFEEEQKVSPSPQSLQRPLTRRQRRLQLRAASPETSSKKPRLSPAPTPQAPKRSGSTTPTSSTPKRGNSPAPSPQAPKRAGSPAPSPKRGGSAAPSPQSSAEPSPNKARAQSVRAEPESGGTIGPETLPTDQSHSEPQRQEKKRPLGILELAAKEFESESSEDETPEIQIPAEVAAARPVPSPSGQHADSLSKESPGAGAGAEAGPKSRPGPEAEPGPRPRPEAGEAEAGPRSIPGPEAEPGPGPSLPPSSLIPAAPESVDAAPTAHLFIFDSESQEDEDPPAAPGGAATPSLTQVQLEEDMQLIRDLVTQSQQDLPTVTKALLKTSGDFSTALKLLLEPSSVPGPFWSRSDDSSLISANPDVRRKLQSKYGHKGVAKRVAFLDLKK